jgi:hypothetical protein
MTTQRWKTASLAFVENDTSPTTAYQGNVFVYRSSATQVTVLVIVFNGNAGAVTKTARTVTVRVRTYLPPFA